MKCAHARGNVGGMRRKGPGKASSVEPSIFLQYVENMSDLLIVESPTKARTIGRMLGGKYRIAASMGHFH